MAINQKIPQGDRWNVVHTHRAVIIFHLIQTVKPKNMERGYFYGANRQKISYYT